MFLNRLVNILVNLFFTSKTSLKFLIKVDDANNKTNKIHNFARHNNIIRKNLSKIKNQNCYAVKYYIKFLILKIIF